MRPRYRPATPLLLQTMRLLRDRAHHARCPCFMTSHGEPLLAMSACLRRYTCRCDTDARVQGIGSRLYSSESSLHYMACHELWELACLRRNHRFMPVGLLDRLTDVLENASELRVRTVAAAVMWKLAESTRTVLRLPFKTLIPALLHAVLSASATGEGKGEVEEGRRLLEDYQMRLSRAASSGQNAQANSAPNPTLVTPNPQPEPRTPNPEPLPPRPNPNAQANSSPTGGQSLMELRVWPAGTAATTTATATSTTYYLRLTTYYSY